MSERVFEFVEGTSSKFWAVSMDASSVTTRWGKIGTGGQSKTKDFPSPEKAKHEYDALVHEKTSKGYVETTKGGPGALATRVAPVATTSAAAKTPAKAKAKPAVADTPVVADAGSTPVADAPGSPRPAGIDLEPEDAFWATFRPRVALTDPDAGAAPFDEAKCFKAFSAIKEPNSYYAWNDLKLPKKPSREEARFWFAAVSVLPTNGSVSVARTKLEKMDFAKPFEPEYVAKSLKSHPETTSWRGRELRRSWMGRALLPGQYADYLATHADDANEHVESFRVNALPHLTTAEVAKLKAAITPDLTPPTTPGSIPFPYYLAALIGCHAEVKQLVESWTSSKDVPGEYEPLRVVLGLGSAEEIALHARRLKFSAYSPILARGWLATTGATALDHFRDSILNLSNKQQITDMLGEIRRIRVPEFAPHALQLRLECSLSGPAREWLDENPEFAAAGLADLVGGRGKLADAATDFFRELKTKGRTALIDSVAKAAVPAVAAAIRTHILEHAEKAYAFVPTASLPKALAAALAAVKPPKLPAWADPVTLPPVLVGAGKLADGDVAKLIGELARAKPGAVVPPVVVAVKEYATAHGLDEFAWRLFVNWQGYGYPPKEKWCFLAVGALGGDGCALKLTPLIREWPGQSQHPRATLGLEVLGAIGSDTALMQLNGIAQKLKFPGLKRKAQEYMEKIAAARGMTKSELEDRIVPDLGLDDAGGRTFDFGPRQFRMTLDAKLSPVIRDADGKEKDDIPKPGVKDDPVKAAEAVAAWKLLKKQLREVLKAQTPRLEQAMIAGRRWPVADFQLFLVNHPLMTNLARRLVWAAYNAAGERTRTFRVSDEREFLAANDRATPLDGVAAVGIVYPLHLSEPERAEWGQVLGDYEIIPPFPQLGRTVYTLTAAEAKETEITRHNGAKVNVLSMVGILDRTGWTRGQPADGGCVHYHTKAFPTAGVTAVLNYADGYPIGYMDGWEDQKLSGVFFLEAGKDAGWYPTAKTAVALKHVDSVAVSEVLVTLGVLASKAK